METFLGDYMLELQDPLTWFWGEGWKTTVVMDECPETGSVESILEMVCTPL